MTIFQTSQPIKEWKLACSTLWTSFCWFSVQISQPNERVKARMFYFVDIVLMVFQTFQPIKELKLACSTFLDTDIFDDFLNLSVKHRVKTRMVNFLDIFFVFFFPKFLSHLKRKQSHVRRSNILGMQYLFYIWHENCSCTLQQHQSYYLGSTLSIKQDQLIFCIHCEPNTYLS